MPKQYWLVKSEPSAYSWQDFLDEGECYWDGVRNYQARNLLRDQIKPGDGVLFYHSNCPEPAIVGLAKVVSEGYPDHTALDPREKHFDPKASDEKPIWFMARRFPLRSVISPLTGLMNCFLSIFSFANPS